MNITVKGTKDNRKALLSELRAGSFITAPIPHMERVNDRIQMRTGGLFNMHAAPAERRAPMIRMAVNSSMVSYLKIRYLRVLPRITTRKKKETHHPRTTEHD